MFTGLIEEVGSVQALVELGDAARVTIHGPLAVSDAKHGDSIQVDGVCLTVVSKTETTFTADVMKQTLDITALGELKTGSRVNLERAARADTRLGGHIVQGHVDGVAKVTNIVPGENWRVVRFKVDRELAKMLVPQGSVTVQGVSLTVSDLSEPISKEHWFEVSLIPETLTATNLGELTEGARVNIETDIIARHVARMLQFATTETPEGKNE